MNPPLSLIAAMTRSRVIGNHNKLPWHLPEDLKYFKAVTLGCPIIMGRKTFDSIGRPLPGRLNLVVTRNADWKVFGTENCSSLENAIERARSGSPRAREIFVIGGTQIFEAALPLADRLYITWIEKEFAGDAHFPLWENARYFESSRRTVNEPFVHHYCVYDRRL